MHKGFKCLNVSTGRIYISRDVVFDEQIFPFSQLHANAGAQLRKEVVPLPPNLLNPGGVSCVTPDITNISGSSDALQEFTAENSESFDAIARENSGYVEAADAEGLEPANSMTGAGSEAVAHVGSETLMHRGPCLLLPLRRVGGIVRLPRSRALCLLARAHLSMWAIRHHQGSLRRVRTLPLATWEARLQRQVS